MKENQKKISDEDKLKLKKLEKELEKVNEVIDEINALINAGINKNGARIISLLESIDINLEIDISDRTVHAYLAQKKYRIQYEIEEILYPKKKYSVLYYAPFENVI
jgi:Na+/phosphate symporter